MLLASYAATWVRLSSPSFAKYMEHVVLHRPHGEVETVSDGAVPKSLCHQSGDPLSAKMV